MIAWIILTFLIAVGLYDLYRIAIKRKTISQKVHEWCGTWGDAAILIGILSLIWMFLGHDYFVTVLLGVILGHFFWQDE